MITKEWTIYETLCEVPLLDKHMKESWYPHQNSPVVERTDWESLLRSVSFSCLIFERQIVNQLSSLMSSTSPSCPTPNNDAAHAGSHPSLQKDILIVTFRLHEMLRKVTISSVFSTLLSLQLLGQSICNIGKDSLNASQMLSFWEI